MRPFYTKAVSFYPFCIERLCSTLADSLSEKQSLEEESETRHDRAERRPKGVYLSWIEEGSSPVRIHPGINQALEMQKGRLDGQVGPVTVSLWSAKHLNRDHVIVEALQ